jgi:hypothetical protein
MNAFYFSRTRKQSAVTLLQNAFIVLPAGLLITYIAYTFFPDPNLDALGPYLYYFIAGVIIIEFALIGCAVWLLKHPAIFEVKLNEKAFVIEHSIRSQWCLSVDPSEISRIENRVARDGPKLMIMTMKNGESHKVSALHYYQFSYKKLYHSLKEINPSIEIPKRPWLFSGKKG